MADFVFPPGGEGVEVIAPNGVKYFWDVDNNRWGIRGTTSSLSEIVKISTIAPEGVEGDLWYKTGSIHKDLYIKHAGIWEQAAPGKQEYDELVDRIALLESTSEIINEYKCTLSTSVGGTAPGQGEFKTSTSNPRYATGLRLHPIDHYGNPIPIIHEGDGLELLHEENGHSHRFKVNSVRTDSPTNLLLSLSFIGGDEDNIKNNDHYLFRFHTPNTDMEVLAHLDRDQTFIGNNQFDGDVVFTGNVTMPDDDGDGSGEESPSLDGDNTYTGNNSFTGNNTFAKTTFKSDDDTHRLYIKDKTNKTNFTIFPTGNISSKGYIGMTAKGTDSFSDLFSAKVKVSHPDGWASNTHGEFGFYVDISDKNTWKNRFVVGGRGSREKAFEVYDDGEGRARVWGSLSTDNKITAGGDVEIRASLGADSDLSETVVGTTYMITAVDFAGGGNNAAIVWARAGAMNLNIGSIFTCVSAETLPDGNTVQEFLGDNHLNVAGDISAGGEISADDVEGHTFLFSGDGALQGNTFIEDATVNGTMSVDGTINLDGSMMVNGTIDLSNATVSNNTPLRKTWFKKVLKEFTGEFRSIYINETNNGTSDPAIEIRADGTASNIKIKTSTGGTGWGVNVGSSLMYGGTSSSPWMATSPQHFATAAYVEQEIAASSGGGPSFGYKFTYTNVKTNMGTGKFTSQNESGTFKLYLSETTADGVTWYDNGDMALKALDFESAGGPGPMYTIRDANDNSKIMRQGFLKAIQYQGNQFIAIFDGASQINVGSMTIGGNYNITIGGLF